MKQRIGILGLGGVGGFVGGRLANKYMDSGQTEVIFIARGANADAIRGKGLKLIDHDKELFVHPADVSSDPGRIGPLDVLICATKSYDILQALAPLAPCISSQTIIVPLLNGVDSTEKIRDMFPDALVADACIYIVARLLEPGVVKVTGDNCALYFGADEMSIKQLEILQDIFFEAGFYSFMFGNIRQVVWEKFLFISAIASMTSYADKTLGEILENEEYRNMLESLLREFIEVAEANQIVFEAGIFDRTLGRMEKLPFEATSSMHDDFKKGRRTEYRSLTEYIIRLGDELGIETPVYDQVLAVLKQKDPS